MFNINKRYVRTFHLITLTGELKVGILAIFPEKVCHSHWNLISFYHSIRIVSISNTMSDRHQFNFCMNKKIQRKKNVLLTSSDINIPRYNRTELIFSQTSVHLCMHLLTIVFSTEWWKYKISIA